METVIAGPVSATATYEDDSGEYRLEMTGDEWLVAESRTFGPATLTVGATIPAEQLSTLSGTFRPEFHRTVQRLHHLPEPSWHYSYEPAPVTCRECGESFPNQELGSDCAYNGDGEDCSFAVCPRCGAWECCDVEYERPETVAAELGLI